jgi:hypothetical protein
VESRSRLLATNLNREETKSAKKDWEREGKSFAGFKNLRGLPFFAVKNRTALKRETTRI